MAVQFYKLAVSEVIRETKDTVTIVFDIPEDLTEEFKYQPGQYLTIKIPIDDPNNNRRAYSICSSPYLDEPLAVTVKQLDMGNVSVYLNEKIKAGDILEVMPPLGNFVPKLNVGTKSYAFYSAGSGITPLFSMIKSILAAESDSKIILFYTSRNYDSIIYRKSLDELQEKYSDRFKIIYSLTNYDETWQGHRGRFNAINLSVLLQKYAASDFRQAEHYMCGPKGLMRQVDDALQLLGISTKSIHKESFTSDEHKHGANNSVLKDIIKRNVKVKLYGETFNIDVEPEDNLTSALQKAGYMPPYSCQIGACSTCRGKVLSGKFVMDICEALTDEEKAEGYILTCRSHPLEENCFVDFD